MKSKQKPKSKCTEWKKPDPVEDPVEFMEWAIWNASPKDKNGNVLELVGADIELAGINIELLPGIDIELLPGIDIDLPGIEVELETEIRKRRQRKPYIYRQRIYDLEELKI